MPEQPKRLRVVFRRAPDPHPEGPRAEILDLIAQGLATRELAEARTEAEASLGRPFQHQPELQAEVSPVEALKGRALRGT